jgi:hypothetical protein
MIQPKLAGNGKGVNRTKVREEVVKVVLYSSTLLFLGQHFVVKSVNAKHHH